MAQFNPNPNCDLPVIMSLSRNLEERAAACLAKFEDKIDSLVSKEKASFKEFCQSEISKVKTNNNSLEDYGIPQWLEGLIK